MKLKFLVFDFGNMKWKIHLRLANQINKMHSTLSVKQIYYCGVSESVACVCVVSKKNYLAKELSWLVFGLIFSRLSLWISIKFVKIGEGFVSQYLLFMLLFDDLFLLTESH